MFQKKKKCHSFIDFILLYFSFAFTFTFDVRIKINQFSISHQVSYRAQEVIEAHVMLKRSLRFNCAQDEEVIEVVLKRKRSHSSVHFEVRLKRTEVMLKRMLTFW